MRASPTRDQNAPRVLFVGPGNSTHTHAWLGLLDGEPFEARLFSVQDAVPLPDVGVRTYLPARPPGASHCPEVTTLFPGRRVGWILRQGLRHLAANRTQVDEWWLARIMRRWCPDVVHTFGLEHAGALYARVRRRLGSSPQPPWVLQLRGGSDLTLSHLDSDRYDELRAVLGSCDHVLSDNRVNVEYIRKLGVDCRSYAPFGPVPGTGGIDVDMMQSMVADPPPERRLILWPKAYECPWSKALPVLEALRLCWERIQPCELLIRAADAEVMSWFRTLPRGMQEQIEIADRIPRDELMREMVRARILLAPSLIDGTPNALFEAMAAGAFPIVSPLPTITPIAEDGRNVLFARNLYPDEIADALDRAMNDDALVAEAAVNNLRVVRQLADRKSVRPKVVAFYRALAGK